MMAWVRSSILLLTVGAGTLTGALVSPDGTGRLPALGWNSWNEFGCNINASVFETIGQRMVSLGLKDVGYTYVNIDDCWSNKTFRRSTTNQELLPDYTKFPAGIDGLASKLHALGLKLGIYSDAGTATCAGYAASLGYEKIDAATFAKWGIDYLKYDNCNVPNNQRDQYTYDPDKQTSNAPAGYNWGTSTSAKRYQAMRDALLAQNRTIQLSMCIWGDAHVEQWGNSTGHSWRMYSDITPEWRVVMMILNQATRFWNTTGFWAHNDWDMLEVGIGSLSYEESRTHFALWAAMKSPLIIGTPLANIKNDMLGILLNRELLDYNQDTVHGEGAMPYKWGVNPDGTFNRTHPAQYWTGSSVKGIHVFMVNTLASAMSVEVVFSQVPALKGAQNGTTYLVHDMWTGKDIGQFNGSVSLQVAKHDTAALRITKLDGTHPNPNWAPY